MTDIPFSFNWNNKLQCNAFTTIRPQASKYKVGEKYNILLKGKLLGIAEIKEIKLVKFDQFNNFIAYIDTGYSLEEMKDILRKMYRENAETITYQFILLHYEKEKLD